MSIIDQTAPLANNEETTRMRCPIPKCLISRPGGLSITVTDHEGNEILFAFSSLGKAQAFCNSIGTQGEPGAWHPYIMDIMEESDDLRSFVDGHAPPEKFLVAIDAKGLTDPVYHVVRLAKLIEAIEHGAQEIEYSEYTPPKSPSEDK